MNEKINRHDRVLVIKGPSQGTLGYVETIQKGTYADLYHVYLYQTANGKKIEAERTLYAEEIKKTRLFDNQYDISPLLDAALDTNDKEWFEKLSESYQQSGEKVTERKG